ncbi:hypothetical protein GYMLUDRAFT_39959 [Collybiopsis luxurians FD-317 M1]|nr:hypothetical protein GYMLUDRAFT_39959 [Collybiopsis luxurians FD-317 M1]
MEWKGTTKAVATSAAYIVWMDGDENGKFHAKDLPYMYAPGEMMLRKTNGVRSGVGVLLVLHLLHLLHLLSVQYLETV